MEESDKRLLQMLKVHLIDLLDNSYCGLIEQIQKILAGESPIEKNDSDVHMYFKLSTFMVQICRLRAYDDLKQRKREAVEQQQKTQAKED